MKQRKKILFIIALLLLLLNGYILINRNAGFKFYPLKTYSEIYQADSSLYITDLFFSQDSVTVFFSHPVTGIYAEGSNQVHTSGNDLTFRLRPGFYEYKLQPVSGNAPILIFQIDHSETATKKMINEFLYSNIPGPGITPGTLRSWENGRSGYSAKEIYAGRKLLEEKTNIRSAKTDEEKLLQIATFISTLNSHTDGENAARVNAYAPMQQITLAMQGKAQLDCGNYSRMLAFFCDIENLPNRRITYRGPDGNWRYGVHYMNEIYLHDKQAWVLADALNNIFIPHDSLHFYNAVDVKKMIAVNGLFGKKIFAVRQDSLREVPYDSVAYWHQYYNRTNASIAYLSPGKERSGIFYELWRFYTFSHNETWYNDNMQNNWPLIILKLLAFYGFVICCVILFLTWKKDRKSVV